MMLKVKERKTKSISKLKKEVRDVVSQYVRMRDSLRTTGTLEYVNCITCSRLLRWKEAHAGHFVDCRYNATRFDETNIHAQCAQCNVYRGGEILKYRREIIRLYGEGYDVQLEEKAMEIKQFTVSELEGLKEIFTKKIKELESSY